MTDMYKHFCVHSKSNIARVWSVVLVLIMVLAGILSGPVNAAASDQSIAGRKAISADPVTPAQARTILGQRTVGSLYNPSTTTPVEIVELAKGLRNDVDLIYRYVHDSIEYEPGYGAKKGALGCLIDKSGNAFDQAALMVALLREAGYTAGYQHGTIRLTGAQVSAWLGTADNVDTVKALLGSAGIPAETVPATGDTAVATVDIDHVWVKVTVDSVDYVFDPAFKQHAFTSPIDLASAMSYNRSSFLTQAGGTISLVLDDDATSYSAVSNFNRAALRSSLETYAFNLTNHLQANMPAADIKEVIGGKDIAPASSNLRQTVHPYEQPGAEDWNTDIPNNYHTIVHITDNGGIEKRFRSQDIYGRRLTVFSAGTVSTLRLDGVSIDTGKADYDLSFDVDHPYAAADDSLADETYGDQKGKVYSLYDAEIFILTAWGRMGPGMIDRHRKILKEALHAGSAEDSEKVVGQTLGLLGFNYLAQLSAAENLTGRLSNTAIISHHNIGVVAQQRSPIAQLPAGLGFTMPFDQNDSFFMDIPINRTSHAGLTSAFNNEISSCMAAAGQASMIESLSINQSSTLDGVSTVKALDAANSGGIQVIKATPANRAVVDPVIRAYSEEAADIVQNLTDGDDPWHVMIPLTTPMTVGDWTGQGMIAVKPDGDAMRHLVNSRKGSLTILANGQTLRVSLKDGSLSTTNKPQNHCTNNATGEPVDMADGRFYHHFEDISVGGDGPTGLDFRRSYYSSMRLDDSGLGYGWGHNHSSSISVESDGLQGLGAWSPYKAAAAIAASYAAEDVLQSGRTLDKVMIASMIHAWLTEQLTDNVASINFPGGSVQFFKKPDGTYGSGSCCGPDQLAKQPDGSFTMTTGGGIVYDFDTQNRLATKTDANGNTVSYTYIDGRLTRVDNSFGRSLTLTWTGDRISSVSDGSRSVSYGYDATGHMVSAADPDGNTSTFQYDAGHRMTKYLKPDNAITPFVENTYNDLGLIETQKIAGSPAYSFYFGEFRNEQVDPAGSSRVWEFKPIAPFGQVKKAIKVTDETGRTVTNEYDGLMRLTSQTMPEGNSVGYTYDNKNNMLSTTAYAKTGGGQLTTSMTYHQAYNRLASITDPLNRTVSFAYDGSGNLTTLTRPQVGGQIPVETFTYNGQGLPLTSTGADGLVTEFGYNTYGDLTSVAQDPTGKNLVTSLGRDAAGNVSSITDPRGNTTTLVYNNRRMVSQSTAPSPFNHVSTFGYDGDGNLINISRQGPPAEAVSSTYSLTGKKLTETSPEGWVTQYQYDVLDRLWKITDPENRVTEYLYDAAGRPTSIINGNGQAEASFGYTTNGLKSWIRDANNNQTTYGYDEYDRLERKTYPDNSFEELTLDNAGRVTSVLARDGRTVSYGLDDLDRITSRTVAGGSTDQYVYDLAGRIIDATTNGLGTYHHVYDTTGRLTSVTDPNSRMLTYDYDDASNRTRVNYPDGSYVLYAYDQLNRMTSVQYDPNADDQAPAPTTVAAYTYDNLSRRSNLTLENAAAAGYGYSANGLLSGINHTASGGNVGFTYGRDKTGLQTSLAVSDNLFAPYTDATGYKDFTANNLNQYTSAFAQSLTYDGNGNLAGDGTNSYVHDALNRMTSAVVGPDTWTYAYGPMDRRVSRSTPGSAVHYLYDGDRVVAEYDGSGALQRKFVYGPGLDEPVMMIVPGAESETRYYYHSDSLGTVIGLTDDSGAWVERYTYSVYGKPSAASAVGNPYMFTGRRLDTETGLYYYRARYYDSNLRRFIEPDPIGYSGGMNLYSYVVNSPVNYVDPWGWAEYIVSYNTISVSWNIGYEYVSGTVIALDRNENKFHYAVNFKGHFFIGDVGIPAGATYTETQIFEDSYDESDVTRVRGLSSFSNVTSSLFPKGFSMGLYKFGKLTSLVDAISDIKGFDLGIGTTQGYILLEGEVYEVTHDHVNKLLCID